MLALAALIVVLSAAGQPRAPADKLTLEEARARKARISDVAYDLSFELDGEAPDFRGTVAMRFELVGSSDDLTVDFTGGDIASVSVNGRAIDAAYNNYYLTLPGAALSAGTNVVDIAFTHPYSTDGAGLYRFRDPEDGRDYLYTDFEPYNQNRLFPAFDQPNLKARYSSEVTVPASWHVISNVRESSVTDRDDRKTWHFPATAPISTYVYALHAGQYHVWESMAGRIPLRLFARESLARYVDADDWFSFTQQGFEFFERYFDVPYAFGKYDQVIVPHFNAGAMENVGAVTFNERYLSRGTVTRDDRFDIASVVLHEMAHMWSGDLVTMDWWNGLWLNESFATFMSTLALAENTEFAEAWENAYRSTARAYVADERDTTHAIELPVPDTDAAFANFDAITYNKGSATLAQLNHLVGAETFRRGVSRYLKRHAFGNSTTDDFFEAISEAANRDLGQWSLDWLHEPGANAVAVELACRNGRVDRLALRQTAPAAWPTLRTHRTELGFFRYEDGRYVVETLPVTYAGSLTDVPEAAGRRCPDVVYANHGDWDYVRVALDIDTLPLIDGRMQAFRDSLTRAMLWQSVWDSVRDARFPVTDYIDFALRNLGSAESDDEIVRQVLGSVRSALGLLTLMDPSGARFGDVARHVEDDLWRRLAAAPPGSDRQLVLFDDFVANAVSDEALERLAGMLETGRAVPRGLRFDQDRRWNVLGVLAAADFDRLGALLTQETVRDPSDQGRLRAIAVRAAEPKAATKQAWLDRLLGDGPVTALADARAAARGLFPRRQVGLRLAFADTVLVALANVTRTKPPELFGAVINGLLGPACDREYLQALDDAIADSDALHPRLARGLKDLRFETARCIAIAARQDTGR